jgi:phosphoribosyl 1,2-cyclic phosphodiesterase
VRVRVWGARGSLASPGPDTIRYGGNTSCVEVRGADGTLVVLDAGTGIRPLGVRLRDEHPGAIHILLTHLHVDHLEGLGIFAPIWSEGAEIHVWGPSSPVSSLGERVARYFSPPLFPVNLADVPAHVTLHDAPEDSWKIGGLTVTSAPILHAGPTVGYRLDEGDRAVAYLTDHEPALGADLETAAEEWISGHGLAFGADLLIHDCQYTDEEYPDHIGWGHSSAGQVAVFAERAKVDRLWLFHHDPLRTDDEVDRMVARVRDRWNVDEARCVAAAEGLETEV